MHEPTRQLVDSFYGAFARRDAEGMIACYAPDVTFSDPVFPGLNADEARAMWRMLTGRAKDLRVTHEVLEATPTSARARWIAHYAFGPKGYPVENRIEAEWTLENGLVKHHVDRFDLTRWARQALGPVGFLFGWAPPIHGQIRKNARAGLDAYMKKT